MRAAQADHAHLFEEIELIDKLLADRNGLNPVEAVLGVSPDRAKDLQAGHLRLMKDARFAYF